MPTLPNNTLGCADTYDVAPTNRVGKYGISQENYPFDKFPPNCHGTIVVSHTTLAGQLSVISQVILPFGNGEVAREDVWITGILPLYLGLRHYKLKTHVFSSSCQEVITKSNLTVSHAVRSAMHDSEKCKNIDAPKFYHKSNWEVLKSIAQLT